nr:MAG TPA: hypothetical protein [Caudoviricetes sp.]
MSVANPARLRPVFLERNYRAVPRYCCAASHGLVHAFCLSMFFTPLIKPIGQGLFHGINPASLQRIFPIRFWFRCSSWQLHDSLI